jgi:hypothetical protein
MDAAHRDPDGGADPVASLPPVEPFDPSRINETLNRALDDHMQVVRRMIWDRAEEIAARDGATGGVRLHHLTGAVEEYAPGRPGLFAAEVDPHKRSVWGRLVESIAPITLISALLTILFGAFGLYVVRNPNQTGLANANGQSYLDIAKIFAGAIVGSAGVAATTVAGRK